MRFAGMLVVLSNLVELQLAQTMPDVLLKGKGRRANTYSLPSDTASGSLCLLMCLWFLQSEAGPLESYREGSLSVLTRM